MIQQIENFLEKGCLHPQKRPLSQISIFTYGQSLFPSVCSQMSRHRVTLLRILTPFSFQYFTPSAESLNVDRVQNSQFVHNTMWNEENLQMYLKNNIIPDKILSGRFNFPGGMRRDSNISHWFISVTESLLKDSRESLHWQMSAPLTSWITLNR